MADGIKTIISVPLVEKMTIVTRPIFFLGENGNFYVLNPGEYKVPMPDFDNKLKIEQQQ